MKTSEPKGDLIIVNALLWDGTENDPEADRFIEIKEGRIIRIDAMAKLSDRQNKNVLDAEGKFVMPGLIDSHCHLVYCRFSGFHEFETWPIEYHTLRASQNAAIMLSYGYTTIRDPGTRGGVTPSLRDAINEGLVKGPRIISCGPIICGTAGLADYLPPWMGAINSICMAVDGIDEVRKAVRTQIKLGVDCIKVGVNGAEASIYSTTEQTSFSPEELRALVAEARRFGKTVACHAQSYDGAKMAVKAGVTTIEHGTRLDDETIALLVQASDTYLVPTISCMYSVINGLSRNPKQIEEMKINQPLWIASLCRAHEAGVKIAAGSDNGNRYLHGEEARELEFLVKHGFTEKKALIAGTRTAAQAIHMLHCVGTLAEKKFGDVLILNDNPFSDIRTLQKRKNIFRVIKGGIVYKPDDLAEEVIPLKPFADV